MLRPNQPVTGALWRPLATEPQPDYDTPVTLSVRRGTYLGHGNSTAVVQGTRIRTDKAGDHYVIDGWGNDGKEWVRVRHDGSVHGTEWTVVAWAPLPEPFDETPVIEPNQPGDITL